VFIRGKGFAVGFLSSLATFAIKLFAFSSPFPDPRSSAQIRGKGFAFPIPAI
jgi:hypothetical protein